MMPSLYQIKQNQNENIIVPTTATDATVLKTFSKQKYQLILPCDEKKEEKASFTKKKFLTTQTIF